MSDLGRSSSEREVLRVLWSSRHELLVRSEVHRRMPAAKRPTLGRVGQILKSFREVGWLESEYRRAQGARNAAFYALSGAGVERCRELGFGKEDRDLFPLEAGMEEHYVTPERIAPPWNGPGKITAFHAHRGGVGRSTMIWYCAKGLVEREECQPLLVADFDLDAPSLDTFFASRGLGRCRGLRGLVVDFYRQPPSDRQRWLRQALTRDEFLLQPLKETQEELFYLPSGFAPGTETGSERAEALDRLWEEVRVQAESRQNPAATAGHFLSELREALSQAYPRVLIDAQKGFSLGAWAATYGLADELVLCHRFSDPEVEGVRAVLANFLRWQEERDALPGCVVFTFAPARFPIRRQEAFSWVKKHVFAGRPHPSLRSENLRIVSVKHNQQVERGHRLGNPQSFMPLIKNLGQPEEMSGASDDERPQIPIGARLYIETVASEMPARSSCDRSILKGAVVSYLATNKLASRIQTEGIETELDSEIIKKASQTQEVIERSDVEVFK